MTTISSTTTTQKLVSSITFYSTTSQGTLTGTCQYPFNPYYCNEGPPITVYGYLDNVSSPCVFLDTAMGNYALYNLPGNYPLGPVEVFGYAYPNWSGGQLFPPYQPFPNHSICYGTPFWVIQIQAY